MPLLKVVKVARAALALVVLAACSSSETAPSPAATPSPFADAAAPASDASAEAGAPTGERIDAAPNTWTWVPFADSSCANGTPTGIGVNPGTSKRLVIYMEGGGACWDQTTCYNLHTAANLDGFDQTKFEARAVQLPGSELDRTSPTNPFKDASFVYIPYCTGDVHAGDREQKYDGTTVTKHLGRRNVAAFLKRIVPTFPAPDRVVLTGSSAGGFGAAVSYWRFKQAFGDVRVDLVDDSGPPFPPAKIIYLPAWEAAWDLAGSASPDCPACAKDISAVFPFYFRTWPNARFALLSSTEDATIRQFFGLTPGQFSAVLADVTTSTFAPSTNGRVFEIAGDSHTMLGNLSTAGGSTTLASWLTAMQDDAAPFVSVTPAQ